MANPNNSVVAFKDNSSTIRGLGEVDVFMPSKPGQPGPVTRQKRDLDLLLTAETHNFPCAVAPYPGAETGAGGRIRDTHATGRGSIMAAATAGYCVGNLQVNFPFFVILVLKRYRNRNRTPLTVSDPPRRTRNPILEPRRAAYPSNRMTHTPTFSDSHPHLPPVTTYTHNLHPMTTYTHNLHPVTH